MTRRAYASGQVEVHLWNPRDYAEGNYRRVDDRPFGGGPGMVMMAEPLQRCLDAIREAGREALPDDAKLPLVLFSPIGATLAPCAVAAVGRQRGCHLAVWALRRAWTSDLSMPMSPRQISLGDFVLSGGEMAALALLDAVTRLQPGVLNDEGSFQQDSFNPALDGLLDCPHYTRPEEWAGHGGAGASDVGPPCPD